METHCFCKYHTEHGGKEDCCECHPNNDCVWEKKFISRTLNNEPISPELQARIEEKWKSYCSIRQQWETNLVYSLDKEFYNPFKTAKTQIDLIIKNIQDLIVAEMLIARQEGTSTSRLTSLYNKFN